MPVSLFALSCVSCGGSVFGRGRRPRYDFHGVDPTRRTENTRNTPGVVTCSWQTLCVNGPSPALPDRALLPSNFALCATLYI
jgi:hypothetical protein